MIDIIPKVVDCMVDKLELDYILKGIISVRTGCLSIVDSSTIGVSSFLMLIDVRRDLSMYRVC